MQEEETGGELTYEQPKQATQSMAPVSLLNFTARSERMLKAM